MPINIFFDNMLIDGYHLHTAKIEQDETDTSKYNVLFYHHATDTTMSGSFVAKQFDSEAAAQTWLSGFADKFKEKYPDAVIDAR